MDISNKDALTIECEHIITYHDSYDYDDIEEKLKNIRALIIAIQEGRGDDPFEL